MGFKEMQITLTEHDIHKGVAGDCRQCAIALALQRATKDEEANVTEIEHVLYLSCWGRYIAAPWQVQRFIWEFDKLPREEDKKPKLPDILPKSLRPFSFVLPDMGREDWKALCYECEQLCDPDELDDEGCCKSCCATTVI